MAFNFLRPLPRRSLETLARRVMDAPCDEPQQGVEQQDFPGVFVFVDGQVREEPPEACVDRSQGVPPDRFSECFFSCLPEAEEEYDSDADGGWDRQCAEDR